jgi:thymidylate kinase
MWISVDGVEAAGKTTLSTLLSERTGGIFSPSFSSSELSKLLRQGVEEHPHVFKRSKLSQTLAFLAEFCERIDEFVLPVSRQGKVVIADRGYLSKYAYQHSVLTMDDTFDSKSAHELLMSIFNCIARPDIIILLECPLDVVERRLAARRYTVTSDRMKFIDRSQLLMQELAAREAAVLRFDSGSVPVEEICDKVLSRLKDGDR